MTHAYQLEGALVDLEESVDLKTDSLDERIDDLEERVERLEEGKDELLAASRSLTRTAARIANAAAELAELPQGVVARKRLLLRVWHSLDATAQQSFLQHVTKAAAE